MRFASLAACLIPAVVAAAPRAKPAVDKALEQARGRMRELHNALVTDNVKLARAQLAATVTIDGLQFTSQACQDALGIRVLKVKRDALAKCLDELVPAFVWTMQDVTATAAGFTTTVEGDCIGHTFELQRKTGLITAIRRIDLNVCSTPGGDDAVDVGGLDDTRPPPPPPPPPPGIGPLNVVPTTLENFRISGERAIVPDDSIKASIADSGTPRVIGSFKLCLDVTGAISTVKLLKSTGYPGYDLKLENRMRQWKYRPYLVDGQPKAVCTAVTFIYEVVVTP